MIMQVDALQVSLHTSNIETNNVCPRRPGGTIYINLYPIRAGFVCSSLMEILELGKSFCHATTTLKRSKLDQRRVYQFQSKMTVREFEYLYSAGRISVINNDNNILLLQH